ncbi:ABC transporter permease [Bradyrhizobium sp. NP1]|uniref:ABC transporter permease n=1 Tax=Bradyrhizobium sp. NP1 TaxID=3049772 RepID=UPI0025A535AE|nr:ABC transporter permease [Bradyrhizobium sp. NP1]WJR74992.1 ABC transporter permease [Bradyrhizobium sp. NP1]
MQPDATLRKNGAIFVLLAPGALLIGIFLAALVVAGLISLHDPEGNVSLAQYRRFLSDPFYLGFMWRSFRVAAYCTPITLLLGYPFAYVMARSGQAVRLTLTLLLVVQFFTSYIVRTYALILVLGNNGIINRALLQLGLIERPVSLLFHEAGVAIGLILVPLPFMIFPIYSVLKNLERNLEAAAASLGASRLRTFVHVTLPLSLPGVLAGIVLVFLFDLTAYIMPGMMGGGYFNMIANIIQEQAMAVLDTPFAAAMSVVLLVIALLTLIVIQRLSSQLRGLRT